MSREVLVLIVTHNGVETITEVLDSLPCASREVSYQILIIDNASKDQTRRHVVMKPGLEVIPLEHNIGVAAAYNMGLERALACGVRWLFILDQDSICEERCLSTLLESAQYLEQAGKRVGAVCPTPKSQKFPQVIHYPYLWKDCRFKPASGEKCDMAIPVDSSISSGTLYNTEALKAINGFREEYFIDFVDHECHLRLKMDGWGMWWIYDAGLFHNLGAIQYVRGGELWIEHQPYRYYYMARNMTEGYYRLGGVKSTLNFWAEAWKHMLLLKRNSTRYIQCYRYFLKGIIHALQNKSGPLSSDN